MTASTSSNARMYNLIGKAFPVALKKPDETDIFDGNTQHLKRFSSPYIPLARMESEVSTFTYTTRWLRESSSRDANSSPTKPHFHFRTSTRPPDTIRRCRSTSHSLRTNGHRLTSLFLNSFMATDHSTPIWQYQFDRSVDSKVHQSCTQKLFLKE